MRVGARFKAEIITAATELDIRPMDVIRMWQQVYLLNQDNNKERY
jgi:hypothetical protein